MRIVRFIDEQGQIQLGNQPLDGDSGQAEVLEGDLFTQVTATGKMVAVAQLLSPIDPVNIFCIRLNYREHAEETGAQLPENPVVFMKPTSAASGPGKPIMIPAFSDPSGEVDYECELAVVIARPVRNVSQADALDYVLGYTAANDVSARKWQKQGGGGQWIRGKSFDTFCPLGPALVTADEITDPQSLAISTMLNGNQMQSSSTSDMIFTVAYLIHFLSKDTTLLPGTVILTGTPSGVGFARDPKVCLKAGDCVKVELAQIGVLENDVIDG